MGSAPVAPQVTPQAVPPVIPPEPPKVVHEEAPAAPAVPVNKPKPAKESVKRLKKVGPQSKVVAPPPSQAPQALPMIPPTPVPPGQAATSGQYGQPLHPQGVGAPEPQEWKGNSDTSITHEGQIVVQNDTQWIRFWSEHHPHEAAPDVDFSSRMVVGIFLGQRPADGFVVEITRIRILADAVVVDYIERAPPPGTFQIAVTAFPYDIKVIPRSTLHVKFNKLQAVYKPEVFPTKSK